LYNTVKIHYTKTKELQVVHSATEVNKTRCLWSQLHSKPKRDGFEGQAGENDQTVVKKENRKGRPKENVLGKSYTNRWLFAYALQREEVMVPTFVLNFT
jgi:hypothetical protein